MQSEEIKLQVAGGHIAGLRWRNSEAAITVPVLALHGWLDNANSFVALAEQLGSRMSDIVAIDLPGHGYSSHRPAGCQYHIIDYVFDVSSVVQQLGWNQFILIGHSMGAAIAMLLAAVAKQDVTHLILIDGIGPLSVTEEGVCDQLTKSIRHYQRINQSSIQQTYPDWDALIKRRMAAGNIGYQDAEKLMKRNARQVNEKILWTADARLKVLSPLYLHEQQVRGFLSSIVAPSLLIQAQSGLVINRPTTLQRIQAVSQITVKTIAGGHHLHMDNSHEVAALITDFL